MRHFANSICKDSSHWIIRCSTHELKWIHLIRWLDDRCGSQDSLQIVKCLYISVIKIKLNIFYSNLDGWKAILLKSLMKLGKQVIASILARSMSKPLLDTTWHKTMHYFTMKWHFSKLSTRLASMHLCKTLAKQSKHA